VQRALREQLDLSGYSAYTNVQRILLVAPGIGAKRWAAKQTCSRFERLLNESPRLCRGMVTHFAQLESPANRFV
jgi:hypothetical protein